MLQFKQNETATNIILTLTELVSIADPYFLFVFTHVLTKDTVALLLNSTDDISSAPTRYNKFLINPSVVFASKQPGEWHYIVHEQASNSNLDPTLSGEIIERGKLFLDRTTDFSYTKYDQPTSFKTYNG